VCGASLAAFQGANTPGWSINGSAAYDSGTNTLVLADGLANGEAGTVFYGTALTANAFTVTFDFRADTTNGRADGLAFVLQTDGATKVGSAYGGFGAMGLNGYAVELDLFDSGPCDPGNGNHAGIDDLSPCPTNTGIPTPLATSPDLFAEGVGDIGDGAWRTATIQLTGGKFLSVTITNASGTPVTVTNLQGVALPNLQGAPFYLGFSAGTGSSFLAARQEIKNVSVTFPSKVCL
jgi:hypothetical protein